MVIRNGWTREQLLVAFSLYCQMPFGKLHSRNPEIIKNANLIGRSPSALAMKLTNIASLDPAITSTGRKGLRGASVADKAMWDEMQTNWKDFANETHQAINSYSEGLTSKTYTNSSLLDNADYSGSNKFVQTKVRIGQAFFRRTVLSAYNFKCCITGLSIPKLLVASHIIPWKDNTENRLNPRNGLCLSALHDKAFDAGIITITENVTVRVSRKDFFEDDGFFSSALLKYDNKPITLPEKFQPHPDFFAYHRKNIYEP